MTDRYESLDDLRSIIEGEIPESVTLEYKGPEAFQDKDKICKTITALANSAGGHFIIGIESENEKPIRLRGFEGKHSKIDWIYRIVNNHTYPVVEFLQVNELIDRDEGKYYVIKVSQSPQAPHQSSDKKYYKRRGTHSDPMEHYEIEDVRNRPKRMLSPLSIEFGLDGQMAYLYLAQLALAMHIRFWYNWGCQIKEPGHGSGHVFGLAFGDR
ncbi:MAG: hypothetical protein GVY09_05225 [Gammaproteobacteria bacterium]|nr:hypothetical protein [Gammaproteobacteria bacterium]